MQVAVVGHRDMGHAHLVARVEHVLQPRGTVQQGVLGVDVEVREGRLGHGDCLRLLFWGVSLEVYVSERPSERPDSDLAAARRRPLAGCRGVTGAAGDCPLCHMPG
ncbi:hypothetical protein SLA_1654 [Streptomyces laurentii]|uniref:Uncharacterized protein n=1 Tax=Streptomyces laurentii TaxID=39478 RepID=A0A169N9N4_STRLU|nr:hypothetical protein SLA_1654 [Streptomyces laurentii]